MNKPKQFLKDLADARAELYKILSSELNPELDPNYGLALGKYGALAGLIPFDENRKRYNLNNIITQTNSGFQIDQETLKTILEPINIHPEGLLQVVAAHNMLQALYEHYENYQNANSFSVLNKVLSAKNDLEFQRAFNLLYHAWNLNPTNQNSTANDKVIQVPTIAIHVHDEPSKKAALIIAKLTDKLKDESNFVKDYLGNFASTALSLVGGFTNEDFQDYTAASAAACHYQIALFECIQRINKLTQQQNQKISSIISTFKLDFKFNIDSFTEKGSTQPDAYADLLSRVSSTAATLQQNLTAIITEYQKKIKEEANVFNERYFAFSGVKITLSDRDHVAHHLTPIKKHIYNDLFSLLNIFKSCYLSSEELSDLTAKTTAIELTADTANETIKHLIERWVSVDNDIQFDLEQFKSGNPQFKLLNKNLLTAKELEFVYHTDIMDITLPGARVVTTRDYQFTLTSFATDVQQHIQRLMLISELQPIKQQVERLQQEAHQLSFKKMSVESKNARDLFPSILQKINQADYLQTEEKNQFIQTCHGLVETLTKIVSAVQETKEELKEGLYEQASETHLVHQKLKQQLTELDLDEQLQVSKDLESVATALQTQSNTAHSELTDLRLEAEELNKQLHTTELELDSLNTELVRTKAQIDAVNQFRAAARNGKFNETSKGYDRLNPAHIEVIKNLANAKSLQGTVQQELETTNKELERTQSQLKTLKNLQGAVKNALGTDDLSLLNSEDLLKAGFSEPELAVWQPVLERAGDAKKSAYSSILNSVANSVTRMKDGQGNAEQLLTIINKKTSEMQHEIEQKKQQLKRISELSQLKNKHAREAEQAIKFKTVPLSSTLQNLQEKISESEERLAKTKQKLEQTELQLKLSEQNLNTIKQKLTLVDLQRTSKSTGKQLNQQLEIILQQINKDHKDILNTSSTLISDATLVNALEKDLLKLQPFMQDAFAHHENDYKQLSFTTNKLTAKHAKYQELEEKLQAIATTLNIKLNELAIDDVADKAQYDELITNYNQQHQILQQCQNEFTHFVKHDLTDDLKTPAENVQKLLTTKFTQESQQFEKIREKQRELREEWVVSDSINYLKDNASVLNGLKNTATKHLGEKIKVQEDTNLNERGIRYAVRSLGLLITQLPGLGKLNKWIDDSFKTESEKAIQALEIQKQDLIKKIEYLDNGLKIVSRMAPNQAKPFTNDLYEKATSLFKESNNLGAKSMIDLTKMAEPLKLPETPTYPNGSAAPNWLKDKNIAADLSSAATVKTPALRR